MNAIVNVIVNAILVNYNHIHITFMIAFIVTSTITFIIAFTIIFVFVTNLLSIRYRFVTILLPIVEKEYHGHKLKTYDHHNEQQNFEDDA